MADRVNVRSTEDMEGLRLAFVRFLERARPAVDEVESEIRYLRDWLEGERLQHWRVQIRRREGMLEDARQHLRAMQSRGPCRSERHQVRLAEEKVEEAHRKMAAVKGWLLRLDSEARDPLTRCRQLSTVLDTELPTAERQLGQMIERLNEYAESSVTRKRGTSRKQVAQMDIDEKDEEVSK